MKKRGMILAAIFLFFVILSFTVEAQEKSSMLALFGDLGRFLFEDLPTLGDYGFKFLFWLVLFALFNFGLNKIPGFERKTAGIVSLALSLLTVILIPGDMIKYLMSTYAIIIVFLFGVFIPVFLVLIVRKNIVGNDLGHRLARAVVYFVVAYALFNFTSYVEVSKIILGIR